MLMKTRNGKVEIQKVSLSPILVYQHRFESVTIKNLRELRAGHRQSNGLGNSIFRESFVRKILSK